jgi:hypothetical protein
VKFQIGLPGGAFHDFVFVFVMRIAQDVAGCEKCMRLPQVAKCGNFVEKK